MALVSGRSFSLNPNAPVFIPFSLRNVEDFSPEWWELVKTSPCFCDYWLNQHQEEDFDSIGVDSDITNSLLETFDICTEEEFPDLEAEFEDLILSSEADEKEKPELVQTDLKDHSKGSKMDAKKVLKDLTITTKSPKKRGLNSSAGLAKYNDKPAKCVSPKCSPRFIHQPR